MGVTSLILWSQRYAQPYTAMRQTDFDKTKQLKTESCPLKRPLRYSVSLAVSHFMHPHASLTGHSL